MDNTKKVFRAIDADGMLTYSPDLRAYLTGFPGSFGFVYTDAQESIFFTDPRYAEAAKKALKNQFIAVEIAKDQNTVLDYIRSKKVRRLAVPRSRVTLPQEEALRKFHFKLVDSDPAFRAAMAVKSAEELACIRRASEIAEEAYASLLGELKEGMTENEVAALLEYKMRLAGAQDRSFETIAAFGANTSVPHHAPCGDKLRRGTLVLLDFGCRWGGYCSDITRTFLFGKNDDADLSAAYMAVYDAHRAAADSIASGMTGKEADALARGSLASRGLDKFFTHSLGHGIGVNIHEFPTLGPSSKDVLEDNMVFSIEPGVYFEGKFGIRIEDSVTLSGGRVVSFMHSDKKLTVL